MRGLILTGSCFMFCIAAASALATENQCVPNGSCDLSEAMAALPQSVRESNVFFPNGGADLDKFAQTQLSLLAKELNTPQLQEICLRIEGHADPKGPEDVNMQISWLRAQSVFSFLSKELGEKNQKWNWRPLGNPNLFQIYPREVS